MKYIIFQVKENCKTDLIFEIILFASHFTSMKLRLGRERTRAESNMSVYKCKNMSLGKLVVGDIEQGNNHYVFTYIADRYVYIINTKSSNPALGIQSSFLAHNDSINEL